jgi:phosphatidylserine synthase 2
VLFNTSPPVEKFRATPFVEEDFIDALYQPHTVTAGVFIIGLVYYISRESHHIEDFIRHAWWHDDNMDVARVKISAMATWFFGLFYFAVQCRDNLLMRPHPFVWRVVHGQAVLYAMVLVAMASQDVSTVRGVVKWMQFDDLKEELPDASKDYAADCRIFSAEEALKTGNWFDLLRPITDRVDVFIISHSLGWLGHALIIRDWTIWWMASFLFEVMEVTYKHWLPNFKECWWDHLFLDLFGCNLLGGVVGFWLVDYFKARKYSWLTLRKIPTARGKINRIFLQFTPMGWTSYEWGVLESPRKLLGVLWLLLVLMQVNVNSFMLKNVLHWNTNFCLNKARLATVGMLSIPAVLEWYQWSTVDTRRMGPNIWLLHVIVGLEVLVIARFSDFDAKAGLFVTPMPEFTFWCWACSWAGLAAWTFNYYSTYGFTPAYKDIMSDMKSTARTAYAEGGPGRAEQVLEKKIAKGIGWSSMQARAKTLDLLLAAWVVPIILLFLEDCWSTYIQDDDGLGLFGSEKHPCGAIQYLSDSC